MKRTSFILGICCLFITLASNAQKIPDYYYDIQGVCTTSYSIKVDSSISYFRYRALTISEEENYYIVIELLDEGNRSVKRKDLVNSISLFAQDFSELVLAKVEYIDWISPNELKVCINNNDIFTIKVGHNKEGTIIRKD